MKIITPAVTTITILEHITFSIIFFLFSSRLCAHGTREEEPLARDRCVASFDVYIFLRQRESFEEITDSRPQCRARLAARRRAPASRELKIGSYTFTRGVPLLSASLSQLARSPFATRPIWHLHLFSIKFSSNTAGDSVTHQCIILASTLPFWLVFFFSQLLTFKTHYIINKSFHYQ